MIEIKNLSKTYYIKDNQVKALNDVSIKVQDGEIFGLIGLSGAGKTTMLRSIASLEKIDQGEIIVNEKNINDFTKKDRRKEIGIVFQGFNLLKQCNVFDNVAFPLTLDKLKKEEIKEKVDNILDLVGIKDKAKAYPSQLSGGQIQRVAIARALVSEPKILLLDEVTSALDPLTTSSILKLLKKINEEKKVTIFIITHDMKVVDKICDTVAILYEGNVIEYGKKEEILNNPKSEIGKFLLKGEEYDKDDN